MKKRVERLRGMYDLLPESYHRQHWLANRLQKFLAQAGYAAVDTPVLEQGDLFLSSFGQELWQNLYAFRQHQRDLCLRPEYTASICRLYLDHYQQQSLPLRFQYAGPVFRYEAPGRQRYRQHTQLGVELLGGQAAIADAEILYQACDMLRDLHIPNYRLELGHIGVASGFIQHLQLDDHAARLLLSLMEQISRSEQGEQAAQARLEALYPAAEESAGAEAQQVDARNVLTLLNGISIAFGDDAARSEIVERFLWRAGRAEQRRQILYALGFLRALHALSGPPPAVFTRIRDLLNHYQLDASPLSELEQLVEVVKACGIEDEQIALNLALGRGVSYYTGLVFEIHAWNEDGFDAQLCGGGRYDRLVRAVGGARDVNACGFAFGLERLLSQMPEEAMPKMRHVQALVIPVSQEDIPYALQAARKMEIMHISAEIDVTGRGLSAGLRMAAKRQMKMALIVGENERRARTITIRDLQTGAEEIVSFDDPNVLIEMKEQYL
jgi:ATP phosphoribosyltransferase regulatory subunit